MDLVIGLVIGMAVATAFGGFWMKHLQRTHQEQLARWKLRAGELTRQHQEQIVALEAQHLESIENARREEAERRRAEGETVALLPGFPFAGADVRLVNSPVDYIVFSGATEIKEGTHSLDELEVIFVEMVEGNKPLSPEQWAVVRAIESGRVRFEMVRVLEDGTAQTEDYSASTQVTPASIRVIQN